MPVSCVRFHATLPFHSVELIMLRLTEITLCEDFFLVELIHRYECSCPHRVPN